MDIYLTIRRKKTTIFIDSKETATVLEFKKALGILAKKDPDEIKIYKDDTQLDDAKTLKDNGVTSDNAKPQEPLTLFMQFKEEGQWENFEKPAVYTSPPELPDVMKTDK
ncbi:Transcription elongation factor B polypeptide 2 isoform X2 [Oopsacas minuta]|uniref:Transcription elongation factor B polypeptide 2 isoform X2 n=1 Tax=Oopsacas minuta TaxID=111878 RepID=A0AAV7JKH3_9METZ|nr:Transcription elongation factor B polypeptide 2 isoform X2 [Oopsacas minuta]